MASGAKVEAQPNGGRNFLACRFSCENKGRTFAGLGYLKYLMQGLANLPMGLVARCFINVEPLPGPQCHQQPPPHAHHHTHTQGHNSFNQTVPELYKENKQGCSADQNII